MKKFINTVSIITASVVALLDFSVISFIIITVQTIIKNSSDRAWFFLAILVFALFIAIKVTIEQFKTGIEFKENICEFNGLDSDNIFEYSEIEEININKDESVSFIKNFTDKSGFINLKMKNGKIHVINLGTISNKKLNQIKEQIEMRR